MAASLTASAAAADEVVVYFSLEMGAGPALRAIFRRAGALGLGDRIAISDAETASEVLDDLLETRPALAVVDSWQVGGCQLADLERWRSLPGLVIVVVSHVNAGGGVKGGHDLAHEVDVVIEMLPEAGGVCRKSRFGAAPGVVRAFDELMFHGATASADVVDLRPRAS